MTHRIGSFEALAAVRGAKKNPDAHARGSVSPTNIADDVGSKSHVIDHHLSKA